MELKPYCESYLDGYPYCSKKPSGSFGYLDGRPGLSVCMTCYRKIFSNTKDIRETDTERWERINKLESIINDIKYYCPKGLRPKKINELKIYGGGFYNSVDVSKYLNTTF